MAQFPQRVNPNDSFELDYFPLNGGLDLTSNKIMVEKGTLLDVSNRETVDRIGYKTIDGFDRYDARTPSTQNEFYYIECYGYSGTLATDFAAGTLLIVDDDTTTVFGKVVSVDQASNTPVSGSTRYRIYYARINEDAEPAVGQVVNKYGTTTPDFRVAVAPTRVSSSNSYYYISTNSYGGTLSSDFPNGTRLVVDSAPSNVFGIVAGTATISSKPSIIFCLVEDDYLPANASTVNGFGTTSPDFTVNVTSTIYSTTTVLTAREVVDSYNTYNASLRTFITDLDDTPIGLHWYRDQLYAVRDDATIYFTQASGSTEIFTNSLLSKDAGASTARVLSIQLTSGAWTSNASGTMQIEVLTGTWGISGTVSVTAPTNTTTFDLRAATAADPQPRYASLWRSRSEQQTVDAGDNPVTEAGWSRIDHGWEFEFENGYSDTGDLVKVSRGSTNNFTYTTSSVTGNSPTETYNGANLDGASFAPKSQAPIGVLVSDANPGWKSTASSASFASDADLATALSGSGTPNAYANIWYAIYGTTGDNQVYARDLDVIGPANAAAVGLVYGGTADAGAVTLDADWYSTQARAPIILKDFSAAMSTIPAGSLITGIGVTVNYGSRHYARGQFTAGSRSVTTFRDYNIAAVSGNIAWEAAVCDVVSGATSNLLGTAQTALITIETDGADYTTDSTTSGYDIFSMAQTAALTGQTATVGGSGNTFGIGATDIDYWLDANKGIALYGQMVASPVYGYTLAGGSSYEAVEGQVRLVVTEVKVTFYYTTPSARYYVGDGAGNVCSIDVVFTVTTDGVWESRTAEGTVQATNLIANVAGTKRTIEDGDKLFLTSSDAAMSSNSILDITSNADYLGLPARNRLITAASRYEFITANFFGRDEWDGFYGVSGCDRAFSFATYDSDNLDNDNEDYIIMIATNTIDTAGDTPRHIAFHHYALALGFRSGIVRFSVPGEPENFSGVSGAAEVGIGDKVTGLLSMRGETLGVFCENSIWGIAGTDADNYQTQVLAPYTGAIEYTVVDMGLPVYCDSRGISTLEQSEKYGNFLGQRLSARVTPFILPRMIRNNAQFSGKGVVCAIPVRAKNQYRLFFKDGKCLVMTMNPDNGPSFTFSDYYIGQSAVTETTKFLVPFAWSSQVDDRGVERIHFSHYSPQSSVSTANGYYVYEMDAGWSFAGNFIPAYYTLNWYYKDPFKDNTIRKLRVDGLTQGVSSCKVYCAKDYDTTFSTTGVDISLPRNPLTAYSVDLIPTTNIATVAERGRSVTLKVTTEIPSGDSITDPIPVDIHQIAMVQFQQGGKPDA